MKESQTMLTSASDLVAFFLHASSDSCMKRLFNAINSTMPPSPVILLVENTVMKGKERPLLCYVIPDGNDGTVTECWFYCGSDQTSTAATAGTDAVAGESDPSRSWAWHQPAGTQSDGTATAGGGATGSGVVVYQLPAATSDATATASSGGDGQPTCYYSVDAFGQIVQQDSAANATAVAAGTASQAAAATGSLRESQLELEVLHLQTALTEKSREVENLRAQLAEAYATVERLKCKTNSEPATAVATPPVASTPSAVSCVSGDQSIASDSVLAADVPTAPSPPS